MRKAIIITCLVLSGLIFLDSINAAHVLVMFFLAGVIPGTSIAISASDMMATFALLTGFVMARIANRFVLYITSRKPLTARA